MIKFSSDHWQVVFVQPSVRRVILREHTPSFFLGFRDLKVFIVKHGFTRNLVPSWRFNKSYTNFSPMDIQYSNVKFRVIETPWSLSSYLKQCGVKYERKCRLIRLILSNRIFTCLHFGFKSTFLNVSRSLLTFIQIYSNHWFYSDPIKRFHRDIYTVKNDQ